VGTQERKEREKEHRREEILNAAQSVFFGKGLQAATMDEIAEAAELSKGTLYLYYKSKEDLYLAVMVRGMETLYGMFMDTISTDRPTIDQLKSLSETYFEFFNRERNYFRMMNFFLHPEFHKQVSREMLDACTVENQRTWNLVIDLLERGVTQGILRRELTSAETAAFLWLSLTAILVRLDTQYEEFKKQLNVDLRELYRKSSSVLLESIMIPEVKQATGSPLLKT
jgi:TetR/AcrR family transcriptional regulator